MTATTDTRIAALRTDPALSPLHRSLDVYYGDPERDARMDAFYSRFVRRGDLVFDIGSHVGDHIGSFRRLGARVVAVEPQPLCLRALRAIYADDDQVTLVDAACGGTPGAPGCTSTPPTPPFRPPRPTSSGRPRARAGGRARCGTPTSRSRWSPSTR